MSLCGAVLVSEFISVPLQFHKDTAGTITLLGLGAPTRGDTCAARVYAKQSSSLYLGTLGTCDNKMSFNQLHMGQAQYGWQLSLPHSQKLLEYMMWHLKIHIIIRPHVLLQLYPLIITCSQLMHQNEPIQYQSL